VHEGWSAAQGDLKLPTLSMSSLLMTCWWAEQVQYKKRNILSQPMQWHPPIVCDAELGSVGWMCPCVVPTGVLAYQQGAKLKHTLADNELA
jgi:hypothetical protein